eukprot:scaffold85951_cov30-Cyclotella_meneghiniana.AAC.2
MEVSEIIDSNRSLIQQHRRHHINEVKSGVGGHHGVSDLGIVEQLDIGIFKRIGLSNVLTPYPDQKAENRNGTELINDYN